jgi:hypothetical protein
MTDSDQPRPDDIDPADLVPLTAEQEAAVLPYLLEQLVPLLQAYTRGMIVARNPEERAILADIDATSGPGSGPVMIDPDQPFQPRLPRKEA